MKDFYHPFCPTLGHLKSATPPFHVFLEFLEYTYIAGKIKFSDERQSKLVKTSSGEHCAPYNFVPTFLACNVQSKSVCLTMHQIK